VIKSTKRVAQAERVKPAKMETPTLRRARMLTVKSLMATTTSAQRDTKTLTAALASMAASVLSE
jgi:hypothetical protein